MKKILNIKALSCSLLFASLSLGSVSHAHNYDLEAQLKKGKIIAKKGDVEIHEGFLELVKRVNPGMEKQLANPAAYKRLVDNLLDQEILYQASVKKGLNSSKEVQEKAALFERIIASKELEDNTFESKAKEYYDKNKSEYHQVKVAHILISTRPVPPKADPKNPAAKPDPAQSKQLLENAKIEAKAKAERIAKELKNGADWNKVVQEHSDDRYSKTRAGEIGYLTKNHRNSKRLDWDALINKAFTIKKGEISEPILAKDGYHIIKILEEPSYQSYEDAKAALSFKLRKKNKDDLIKELSGDSKVEYMDPKINEFVKKSETPIKPQGPVPLTK